MIARPLCRGMGFFSLIWVGQAVSIVGSRTSAFAIGVSLFLATDSVTRYTLIGLSVALPLILLTPVAGVLADRYERRHVLLVSIFGSALGSIALFWVVRHGGVESWQVYALVAYKSGCNAFLWPAFTAASTLIVGRGNFARASGLNNIGVSLGQVLGPLLGGALLGTLGLETILLIDVASFLVALAILLLVRFPQPGETAAAVSPVPATAASATAAPAIVASVDAATAATETPDAGGGARPSRGKVDPLLGWRFVRERPGLLRLLALGAALQFALGFTQVLFTPLVLSFANPAVLGMVLAVAASGMLIGGLLISVWGGPSPERRIETILAVLAAEGLVLTLAGLQPSAMLVASAAFFFMFGLPILGGATQAIWQSKVPPELQGRAFAVRGLVIGGAAPLAIAAAGPLSDHVFEPLLARDGPLAASLGQLLGTGPGRGIGLFLVLTGLSLTLVAAAASRSRILRRLEEDVPDAEGIGGEERRARRKDPDAGVLPRLPGGVAAALAAVLVAVAALALLTQRPPPASGAEAPASEFSAARAFEHLRVVAARPHPTGSAAQRQVRDDLLAELEALGLETEVQRSVAVSQESAVVRLVRVENVAARLPGRGARADGAEGADGVVILSAHYDSVPDSPGAGDNAAAVASLLETARALAAGEPLARDVVFLFTDAEELGLLGARVFVEEHRWARDVEAVINLDARGRGGPVLMFETGAENGRLVPHLREVERPVASSLMSWIYELMPNATDFDVFRAAGYAGLNLAFLEGLTHYHTALDRPEDVDPRSIQHQGAYALTLARRLAASTDAGPAPAPRAYFSLPGVFVHYPRALAALSAVAAGGVFLALLALGLRRRQLTAVGLLQGFAAHFGLLILVPLAVTLLWALVRSVAGVPVVMGSTGGASRYMLAFAVLAVAAFLVLYRFFRRFLRPADLAAGALGWWLVLLVLLSGVWLPVETNFLAAWPLLFAAGGALLLLLRPAIGRRPWLAGAVLALAALPGVLLVVPFTALVYVGLQGLFELGGAALMPLVLLLGLLIPQLEALSARRPAWPPAAAAGLGAILLVAAVVDPEGPRRQNSVLYALDADAGESHWFSLDRELDDWTAGFGFEPGRLGPFGHLFPRVERDLLRAPAPAVALEAPGAELLERRDAGRTVELRLVLRATPGAQLRAIWLEPADAAISADLAGRTLMLAAPDGGTARLILEVPPPAAEELVLRLRAGAEEITLHLTEQLEGLPPVPGLEPRPPDTIPSPLFLMVRSDVTLVHRSLTLPAAGESSMTRR